MSYNYDKFLRPITPFDKSIKILDEFNNIKYTINPFVIKNVAISNNILKINLKSQRVISLHFPTINEAKLALTRIQIQIDTLIKNVPLIDRDVKNYVDSIFNKVDRYSATSSTPFQLPIIGDIINLETQKNLAYTSPQSVIIHNDISNLGNDYFVGKIDSYDKNTGDMVILVDFSTNIVTGETYSTWYINLSGEKGQADKYYTISSTTFSVPEIGQVVDLQVEPYLAYSSSQNVVVYSDLPNLYDNDYQIEGGYFSGQVDYYDFSTGLISIVVDNSIGIGTYSTWYMNLSGVPGVSASSSVPLNLTNLTTDIIPAVNSQYNLGTSASQWKSLHVSGQTIYIGGVPLSTDNGSLVVSSINLGTTASPLILSAENDVLLLNGIDSVGATGPTGATGLVWQGLWNFHNIYNMNDAVSFASASWFCYATVSTPTVSNPSQDTQHWILLAGRGSKGDTGATGSVETTDKLISTNNLEVVLDSKGTLNTPLLLPIGFTAICDESHMVGSVVLDGSYWEFQVEFQVSPYGIVAVMINNIFPILYNPGYDSGYTFRFTEADHGISNYNFDIELNDVVWSGPAGWTSNLAVTEGPTYPSTIKSLGAVKITANNKHLTFGTDGTLTFPDGTIQFVEGSSIESIPNGLSASTMFLKPDSSLHTDQYIVLDTTAGVTNHIHIRAGGDIDDSAADLFIGGENNNLRVSDTTKAVEINSKNIYVQDSASFPSGTTYDSATWSNNLITITNTIGDLGDFINGYVMETDEFIVFYNGSGGNGGINLNISNKDISNYPTIILTVDQTPITPDLNLTQMYLQINRYQSGRVIADNGTITIQAGDIEAPKNWTFGMTGGNGIITFPNGSVQTTAYPGTPTFISSGITAPGSAVVANETHVSINFSDGGSGAWTFSTTEMSFPDNTVQTTAYAPKYKVYTALLSQSGTASPTAIVLENTLGGTVTWSYNDVGFYYATLTGAFLLNKTTATISVTNGNTTLIINRDTNDQVVLLSRDFLGVPADNIINNCTLEIKVYN